MYYQLIAWDHQLFLWINHWPHTAFTNALAMGLSGLGVGGLIWLLISIVLFIRETRRDHWFFLPVVLASALSLIVTEFILKNVFLRPRPPLALGAWLIAGPSNDFSFPSGHATFSWALAIVLARKEPRAKYIFYVLAFLISLSRIYLGKHYPADIVAGSVVGVTIGLFSLWVEEVVRKSRNMVKLSHDKVKRKRTPHYRS